MDHLEKALKLALLCAKQTPSQRPTMYDVAQVLSSLLPVVSPPYKPPSYPTYSAKQAEDIIASSSTSGGDLLDQFEDVISRNI
jgi:hypothetical protein